MLVSNEVLPNWPIGASALALGPASTCQLCTVVAPFQLAYTRVPPDVGVTASDGGVLGCPHH
jgi:hypothetical protein